ncbi:hypothetical protein, partial [Vibrio cholerae]
YGDNEYFPQMYNYEIYGIYNGKLKYYNKTPEGISPRTTAGLRAFAQRDEVDTFMQGISKPIRDNFNKNADDMFDFTRNLINELIDNELPEEVRDRIKTEYENKIQEKSFDISQDTR